MDIHRTKKTGPSLEDKAHRLAEDPVAADVGIVKSTESGEVFAYRGEKIRGRYVSTEVESVDHSPESAAFVLFSHAWVGEVWNEDRRLIIGAELLDGDVQYAIDLVEDHLPEKTDVLVGSDEYRYIDDMSRRGGMIYHTSDYQEIGGTLHTRPAVQEDPEMYLEALLESAQFPDATLIEDTSVLEEAGFEPEGEYVSSMHSTETSTSPAEKREELAEQGLDAIFFATGSKGNPFRTKFEVWTRPTGEPARA